MIEELLGDLLAGATVVRLEPQDVVILRLAHTAMMPPEAATLVWDAFTPNLVVVLSSDVDLGVVVAPGDVRWLTS